MFRILKSCYFYVEFLIDMLLYSTYLLGMKRMKQKTMKTFPIKGLLTKKDIETVFKLIEQSKYKYEYKIKKNEGIKTFVSNNTLGME